MINKLMNRMCDFIIFAILLMFSVALLFMFIAFITGDIATLQQGNCQW